VNVADEIQLHLRTAAANSRIAGEVERKAEAEYEEKMKSAGASLFAAFRMAVETAPEFAGRRIDEKTVARLYESNRPRPWWDKHLAAVKVDGRPATREWASRTLQWHLDPDAAKSRRAQHTARLAANYAKNKAKPVGRGAQAPQPRRADIDRVNDAVQEAANDERAVAVRDEFEPVEDITMDALLGEVNRISSAVRKVGQADRETVLAILKTAAREIERFA
jgi:hypothetical protein